MSFLGSGSSVRVIFRPRVLAVVSHYPLFDAFEQALVDLLRRSQDKEKHKQKTTTYEQLVTTAKINIL